MQTVVCLYLHGFLSSGNSFKAQWIKQSCQAWKDIDIMDFRTPNYTLRSPESSVAAIEEALQKLKADYPHSQIVLIGSSLGGFYAQYFAHRHKLPYVMINPALHPQELFPEYLGEHFNPHSGETICINPHYLEALQKYDIVKPDHTLHSLLAVDLEDEVVNITATIKKYQAKPDRHFLAAYPGGNHAFQHLEAFFSELTAFIKKLIQLKASSDHIFIAKK
ncbi:YqiA/YcfP family alpha/beta fold hydrolase [Thiomicrorhabdus sp.]|uniref:YqiA/YcfP family alpha/beta fold hydrolase n=1 Tax=Thiomicrorhabdus sp. TaxID=2039724 RepID=UPI0029C8C23E|nr:YqiA/YcfP family alpha/beta fold hydrolase [Thiomicrorhabdus sp.]